MTGYSDNGHDFLVPQIPEGCEQPYRMFL